MSVEITIGCDPELFGKRKGRFISVHDILVGSKTHPCKVTHGAVQVDGVAAEFNIDPAKTVEDFVRNIQSVTKTLQFILNARSSGVQLVAEPTATFNKRYFNSLPFITKALGCEPDYSAYTGEANPKPETDEPFRTGAGHVHIGLIEEGKTVNDTLSKQHMDTCSTLVKELDITLYEASKVWDSDTKRMALYGKPGAFRPKVYGLEYRTLSNAWLRREETMRYVFDATKETTRRFLTGTNSIYTKYHRDHPKGSGASVSDLCKFLSSIQMPTPLDYVSTTA